MATYTIHRAPEPGDYESTPVDTFGTLEAAKDALESKQKLHGGRAFFLSADSG